ncbi:hypothetical protein BJX64DRAFT_212876 [Aspergillus heterothallicus]
MRGRSSHYLSLLMALFVSHSSVCTFLTSFTGIVVMCVFFISIVYYIRRIMRIPFYPTEYLDYPPPERGFKSNELHPRGTLSRAWLQHHLSLSPLPSSPPTS